MNPSLLDIIIVLTMLVSGVLALTQGFIKEILSLVGWLISFITVILLMPQAGEYLRPFIESEALSDLITISVIFILTLLTWRLFSLLVGRLFKLNSIGYIDRALGFLFGVLRIYILASLIFGIFVQSLEINKRPLYVKSSLIIPIIENSNNFFINIFPELKSFNYQSYNIDNEDLLSEENEDIKFE